MIRDLEDDAPSGLERDAVRSVETLANVQLERFKLEMAREQWKRDRQLRAMDDRRDNDRRRYCLQLLVIRSGVIVMMAMAILVCLAAVYGHYDVAGIVLGTITTLATLLCACVFPEERRAILRAARRRAKAVARLSRKLARKRKASRSSAPKRDVVNARQLRKTSVQIG